MAKYIERNPRLTMWFWTIVVGLFGPSIALFVTWNPVLNVTRIDTSEPPDPRIIQELRAEPSDIVLKEIRDLAVGVPFSQLSPDEAIEVAEKILDGVIAVGSESYRIQYPFVASDDVFRQISTNLWICSFAVPNLLASAYELSGQTKYLRAAVDYVLAWSEFESSLLLPRGLVFNDHAVSARAIILTEIWRLYRTSKIFQIDDASNLLVYVSRLAFLLREPGLFEYRTNHGLMQSLALVHLGTAFPSLDSGKIGKSTKIGIDRLLSQFPHYVNGEGVVLEHSPGYHYHGLSFFAATFRFLELHGRPIPDELKDRYQSALEFDAVLRRPDDTLPPIGDTSDDAYPSIGTNSGTGKSVSPYQVTGPSINASIPARTTIKPSAGYAVLWGGLDNWPDQKSLNQTVLHWGNFPTNVHKHADDLGLSIWSTGTQWIRSVGYWPYDETRPHAVGWQSSNAPHWQGESPKVARTSSLISSVTEEQLSFFELLRKNSDESQVRRQLVKVGNQFWAVLDYFESSTDDAAEIIWRLSPDVSIRPLGPDDYLFETVGLDHGMRLRFAHNSHWRINVDALGTHEWNTGVVVGRTVTASPAIRIRSETHNPVILAVFETLDPVTDNSPNESLVLQWKNANNWKFSIQRAGDARRTVERTADSIVVVESGVEKLRSTIRKHAHSASDYRIQSLNSLSEATRHYGRPFNARLERRFKVSWAIVVLAIIQLVLFSVTRAGLPKLRHLSFTVSIAAWIGLSLFLGLSFLA